MVTTFQRQEPAPRVVLASAVALMVHYFDIREVDAWTEVLHLAGRNPPSWIRIAVIEALYQGRYKVVSVQQILDIWRRRGRILSHFNREFEAIVTVPLPDRVQAHLRALAREHQEEHRQHRLQEDQGADRDAVRDVVREKSTTPEEIPESMPVDLPEQAKPTIPPGATVTVPPQADPSPIDALAPDPVPEAHPAASIEDRATAPEATEAVANLAPATEMVQTGEHPHETNGFAASASSTATSSTAAYLAVSVPHHPAAPSARDSFTLQPSSRRRSSSQIDQFCPTPDRSGFDRKLLALANQS